VRNQLHQRQLRLCLNVGKCVCQLEIAVQEDFLSSQIQIAAGFRQQLINGDASCQNGACQDEIAHSLLSEEGTGLGGGSGMECPRRALHLRIVPVTQGDVR